MTFEVLIPVIIVAILTTVGNILFFKYQFKKDNKWKVLNQQLKDLLLPLYYILKEDELNQSEWFRCDNMDPHEFIAEEPKRLKEKIIHIVKEKMYLADNELHTSCIEFLEWAYRVDENERFEKSHVKGVGIDKVFLDFKSLVFTKYNKARNDYLK